MSFNVKKVAAAAAVATSLVLSFGAFNSAFANTTLTVGATPVPHAEILQHIVPALKKEGVDLKIVVFNDYVKPNLALNDKDLDANYFQHRPFLDDYCKKRGCELDFIQPVSLIPMAIFSQKVKSLDAIPDGATVAIPNDPTNSGRALLLLQDKGLIKLRNGSSIGATSRDVVENPKHLRFKELDASFLPRTLPDVDVAVINANFALGAGLNPVTDSIAHEDDRSVYSVGLTVRKGDHRPEIEKLKQVITSPEVKEYIKEKYKGSVIPVF